MRRRPTFSEANVDHSEFRGYVFALLFFKRISDVYVEEVIKLTAVLGDETLAKDPKIHNFVVPNDCLWDNVARKSRNQVGTALNDAMIAIERANQPKFDGILTGGIDFNDSEKLPRDKLIKLINHFGSRVFDHANVSGRRLWQRLRVPGPRLRQQGRQVQRRVLYAQGGRLPSSREKPPPLRRHCRGHPRARPGLSEILRNQRNRLLKEFVYFH